MQRQSFNKHFSDHIAGDFHGEMPFRRREKKEAAVPLHAAEPISENQKSESNSGERLEIEQPPVITSPKLSIQEQLEKRRLARDVAMSVHIYRDANRNKTEIDRGKVEINGNSEIEKSRATAEVSKMFEAEMERNKEIRLEERFSKEYFQPQQYQQCIGDEPIIRSESKHENTDQRLFIRKKKFFRMPKFAIPEISLRGAAYSFALFALLMTGSVGMFAYVKKGLGLRERVLGVSQEGMASLEGAANSVAKQDFAFSSEEFSQAQEKFSKAANDIDDLGGLLVDASKYFPGLSKLSSGKYAMDAAQHLSAAGKEITQIVSIISVIKNPLSSDDGKNQSLLEIFNNSKGHVITAREELIAANDALANVKIDDLPEDKRDRFVLLKQSLPSVIEACDAFVGNSDVLADVFGANGPRKYLFLFQNNTEIRPTGGFIGSYGLLDIANGRIRNFFIDGIFNPDGQLKDKIVPPSPIQKMSAAWSLHDSNWWPDFPTSAKEAINFYERTGGPTADGVITFTPTVMQKLLEITGPIEMPEYDVVLDKDNFIEKTQYEVEVDYDKEENKPKKILSDLAPMVLDKLLSSRDAETVSKTMLALSDALAQKHILIYSTNEKLQAMISKRGWSGEILSSDKDYLSVINTNINGYKTDGVIDETIKHRAEIAADGSIVDTVTVTRVHKGGSTEYDWWNKVNSDYLRVYVPLGSQLLEVSGQTREFTKPPLDYDALGFKRDPLVVKEESSMSIDDKTGTRTYEEANKTVFANWAYVSPGETVSVSYKYRLPFKLFQVTSGEANYDAYTLVTQKQSGSIGSKLESTLVYPREFALEWESQQETKKQDGEIYNEKKLDTDRFFGYVFGKK